MCIWEGKLHFQKEANWGAKCEWWMMFAVYLRDSAWELQCHHPVPIYLHWLMMSSADDLFVSGLVWACLCFISTRLITHLWLRINLTKALAMTPTSALGAKWKYNWATAITTYRDREREIHYGYGWMNAVFLFRGHVWKGLIASVLVNQLQLHFSKWRGL